MCFAAVLAFSAVAVGSASATELLASAASGSFKAVGGEAKLFGAGEVKCSSTTTSGTFEDAHLGKITVLFEGCKVGSIVCTGTKDTISGHITFEGTYHIDLARSGPTGEPHAAILVLIPVGSNVIFNCPLLGNIEVKGSVIGLLFKKDGTRLVPTENFLNSVISFKSAKSTKQEDQEFLLALSTPELPELMTGQHLQSNIFGGGFSESGQEGEGEITTATPTGVHLVTG